MRFTNFLARSRRLTVNLKDERQEMIGQLYALALLFVLIFGLNLNPAFAPPT